MPTLEQRVTQLETEVKQLRESRPEPPKNNAWVNEIFGAFQDDPLFEKAVESGIKYRKSQRPNYETSPDVPA